MAHPTAESKAEEAGFPASESRSITPGTTVNPESDEEKGLQGGAPAGEKAPDAKGFEVPDGGWRAWSVVMGSFLVLFSTFGYVNAFGVYQSYYSQHLGASDSTISWIGSVQMFMQFGGGIVSGRLFDEGYCREMLGLGSVIYIVSTFMLSITKNKFYQVFLAQGVGQGLGIGLMFLPATSVISHWFLRRRSYAVGIVVSGSSVGGMLFPIMLNRLMPPLGFGSAVRATAYIILGCLIIANLTIMPRLPPMKLRPAHLQVPKPNIKKILSHPAYWFAIAGGFFCVWGVFMPFFYLQVYAESRGVEENLAFYSLSIMNATSIFGRVLPNFLADKVGPFNMIIPFSAASGILIFSWLGVHTSAGLVVYSLMFGFFSGAFVSLVPSALMSLASNVGEMGVRVGMAFFIYAFAALTGTPIAGALLGPDKEWWKPTVFSGTTVLAGTALLCVARSLHAKEKGTWKV